MTSFTHAKALQIAEEVVGWLRPGCDGVETMLAAALSPTHHISSIELRATAKPRVDAFGAPLTDEPSALVDALEEAVADRRLRLVRMPMETRLGAKEVIFEHVRSGIPVYLTVFGAERPEMGE